MAEDELVRPTTHEFVPLIHPADFKQSSATATSTTTSPTIDDDDDDASPTLNTRVITDEPLSNQKVVHVLNNYFDNVVDDTTDTFHSIISDGEESSAEEDEDDVTTSGNESFNLNSVLSPPVQSPGRSHGPGLHEQQTTVSQPLLEDDPLVIGDKRIEVPIDDEYDEVVLLDIDPSALSLSLPSSQENDDRNNYFRSIFDVPETEKVIEGL